MNSITDDIAIDLSPVMLVYKDGRIKRFNAGPDDVFIPPSFDVSTGVTSKDIVIDAETNVSARLYHPNTRNTNNKLSLLVYFHGGGFVIGSTFSAIYQPFLNSISSKSNTLIVSIEYRLAPEYKLPVAYDDCFRALQWVTSHTAGQEHEPWLSTKTVDYSKVFLGGDSAGGNIAHNVCMRCLPSELHGVSVEGMMLFHPYFWGVDRLMSGAGGMIRAESCDKMWPFVTDGLGNDDPRINPVAREAVGMLKDLPCRRVLVEVAEIDTLCERGKLYCLELSKSGWAGDVVVRETKGEDHVFFLFYPNTEKAERLMENLVQFLRKGMD